MLKSSQFDPLAVQAAFVAVVVAHSRTKKGKSRLNEAIAMLQALTVKETVVPLRKSAKARDCETLDNAVVFLEWVMELTEE